MTLTDLAIRKFPLPQSGQKTYWEKGFGVRVSQGGSKSFVVKHEGKLTTIGKYPAISLKAARDVALRHKLSETPKVRLNSLTVARDTYLAECAQKNAPKTVEGYTHYLNMLEGDLLSDITKHDVDPKNPHQVSATKVFFNWCLRNELVDKNPFSLMSVKYNQRDRVLSDEEIKIIWAYDYPPYSDHLKILLLTGQRRGQIANFAQSWLQDDLIQFPVSIMKGTKPHALPVTPFVADLLKQHQPFNGWSKAKSRIDRFVTIPHWTTHDLRRTHSTIQARLGTPIHVTEAILAHTSGTISGVSAIYNRHSYLEESRKALLQFEEFITKLTAPEG